MYKKKIENNWAKAKFQQLTQSNADSSPLFYMCQKTVQLIIYQLALQFNEL